MNNILLVMTDQWGINEHGLEWVAQIVPRARFESVDGNTVRFSNQSGAIGIRVP